MPSAHRGPGNQEIETKVFAIEICGKRMFYVFPDIVDNLLKDTHLI